MLHERYIVNPGQACAYKVGQLKILQLREKAKQDLGSKFNLKDFHNVVLQNGAMPLQILEQQVERYVRTKNQTQSKSSLGRDESRPHKPYKQVGATFMAPVF